MAEIGKVTPGAPIVTRLPRERAATDGQEHPPQPGDTQKEKQGHDDDEDKKSDEDGGIDLYV